MFRSKWRGTVVVVEQVVSGQRLRSGLLMTTDTPIYILTHVYTQPEKPCHEIIEAMGRWWLGQRSRNPECGTQPRQVLVSTRAPNSPETTVDQSTVPQRPLRLSQPTKVEIMPLLLLPALLTIYAIKMVQYNQIQCHQ